MRVARTGVSRERVFRPLVSSRWQRIRSTAGQRAVRGPSVTAAQDERMVTVQELADEAVFARELGEQLSLVYSGAVPPERVRACVAREVHEMRGVCADRGRFGRLVESNVRRKLALYAARPS